MPIAIEGGRIPVLLKRAKAFESQHVPNSPHVSPDLLRIALVNNMPDAALEDTELQFFDLLSAAAVATPISLKLFSLPDVPRTDAGEKHLRNFYSGADELLSSRFDGVIITGTEPRRPNLRDEPYWRALVEVFSWAETNTTSTILSCLAAHAGVLATDDIPRSPLGDKQFGVFEYKTLTPHPLTEGIGNSMRIPHSRWNEVKADALTSCGYQVLTQSANAGVDLFVKQKQNSLFVHFQGHPEYNTRTLLKEYRRDIKRFLRRERETYPSLPQGYFDEAASGLLEDFRSRAVADPVDGMLAQFPEAAVAATVQNIWQKAGIQVYRNWLEYLGSKKSEGSTLASLAPVIRA
jgi:homoserine O-succinyltransferase/O-acetyltransferase